MTGKKRQRYDFLPRYASVAFDLQFQFLGDFGSPGLMRAELEGSREKKVVRRPVLTSATNYAAALLCNQKPDEKLSRRSKKRSASRTARSEPGLASERGASVCAREVLAVTPAFCHRPHGFLGSRFTTRRCGTARRARASTSARLDKLRIAEKLDAFGMHYIEGGWPGSNPKDAEFFEAGEAL